MALNPAIALQYRQPDFINPAQMLTLQNVAQQSQLGRMQLEDAERVRAERNQLKALFANPEAVDPGTGMVSLKGIQDVYAISPEKGAELAGKRQTHLKTAAEMAKLELETRASRARFLRDGLARVTDQATYDLWREEGAKLGSQAAAKAPAVFDPAWQRQNVMDADKFIAQHTPRVEMVDIGGQKVAIDTNPVTNPAIKGTKLAKTMTPSERAAEARAAATQSRAEDTARNTQENMMRDDFTRASVEFVKVRDAHQRVIESAADPSAAGDLALIFNYMKVLDPGSTVREGEFATAQSAGGVPDRIWAQYNRVLSGERLAPDVRKDFLDRSGRLYQGAVSNQEEIEKDYEEKATRAKVRPEQVVTRHRVKEKKVPETDPLKEVAPLTPAEKQELEALRARFKSGR